MNLSVIIVSYNAKELLKQCLDAALQALSEADFTGEVILVDNHSADQGAVEMAPAYPSVRFVFNKENIGFARACNQGASLASGEFLLFLNPDTIVPRDSFKKVIDFMKADPAIGASGIKMLDEQGRFLKESKRGYPSPLVSFFKLSGLAALFPGSKLFARYYLGHLDPDQTQEVEILSGAFMLVRKKVFDSVAGFDERFFMYAEDIDLSHRIGKAGYKLMYFAGSSITHYKGGSTPKDIRRVKLFYRAMAQFAEKQYGKKNPYTVWLKGGIWIRGMISATAVWLKKLTGR